MFAGTPATPGNVRARLYVGSVPFDISADALKAVFSAFGEVRSCELLPPTDQTQGHPHRGYGFLEFAVSWAQCVGIRADYSTDFGVCDNSVREKDWRCGARVTAARVLERVTVTLTGSCCKRSCGSASSCFACDCYSI